MSENEVCVFGIELIDNCGELSICRLRREWCCCSALSRSGKLGSDARWNDLPNAIFLGCWLWESLSFCEILTVHCSFKDVFTSAPNEKS